MHFTISYAKNQHDYFFTYTVYSKVLFGMFVKIFRCVVFINNVFFFWQKYKENNISILTNFIYIYIILKSSSPGFFTSQNLNLR